MIFFKSAQEVSKEYGIPLTTVYHRMRTHKYRVNDNNDVLISDVEKLAAESIKKGRPVGASDKRKRKKRRDYETNKNKKAYFKKF